MSSANTLFMEIQGIKGNVTDVGFKGCIAIYHVNTGVYSSASINNGNNTLKSEGVHFDSVSFSKDLDSTSTQLFMAVTQGKTIPKIEIAKCVQVGEDVDKVVCWTYTDCIFTACTPNIQDGGELTESLSFVYSTVKFETNLCDSTGKTTKQGPVGYDLVKNKIQ